MTINEQEIKRIRSKPFPIQSDRNRPAPNSCPWHIAERAYSVYAAANGTSQSIERIAQRGGFSALEMDFLCPGWVSEREHFNLMDAEINRLRAKLLQESLGSTYRAEVLRNCPGFESDPIEKKLSLGGLGIAGEGGEVADLVKKILHHDVPLATVREKLIKEMGDVRWYMEYLAASLGVTMAEVEAANIAKLRARHPNGWSPQSQQAKADEAKA